MLVAQDGFTKFVVLKPLRSATAKTIIKALKENFFAVFGTPRYLHTNNGTEFDNNTVCAQCTELGIEVTTIPPYHPQANPTERANRNLKALIRFFLKDNHRLWDEHIDDFSFAINNSVHESTGFSLFFLNYGRNPRTVHFELTENSSKLHRSDPKFWADRVS